MMLTQGTPVGFEPLTQGHPRGFRPPSPPTHQNRLILSLNPPLLPPPFLRQNQLLAPTPPPIYLLKQRELQLGRPSFRNNGDNRKESNHVTVCVLHEPGAGLYVAYSVTESMQAGKAYYYHGFGLMRSDYGPSYPNMIIAQLLLDDFPQWILQPSSCWSGKAPMLQNRVCKYPSLESGLRHPKRKIKANPNHIGIYIPPKDPKSYFKKLVQIKHVFRDFRV